MAPNWKTFIVDDEIRAIESLRNQIGEYLPQLSIVGTARSVPEAVTGILDTKPDLVFLDVQIGDALGFEVLNQTSFLGYKVIFTTAHSQYAIEAIRYAAADYLLKPIGPNDLYQSLKRLSNPLNPTPNKAEMAQVLQDVSRESVLISGQTEYVLAQVKQIIRCESESNYTRIVLEGLPPIVASQPIKEYARLLPGNRFFRVHKSHLVNRSFIQRIKKMEDGEIVLSNGELIPLARRRKTDFLQWIQEP